MKKNQIFNLAITSIIAALYFVLTFFTPMLSYGIIQFRVAEAMTLLPLLLPQAVVGLTLGCFLANIFSPFLFADIILGTLATLIASSLTYLIGKKFKNCNFKAIVLGGIPPIIVNALLLPLIWLIFSNNTAYFLNFSTTAVSQAIIVYTLGALLITGIKDIKIFKNYK